MLEQDLPQATLDEFNRLGFQIALQRSSNVIDDETDELILHRFPGDDPVVEKVELHRQFDLWYGTFVKITDPEGSTIFFTSPYKATPEEVLRWLETRLKF